MRLSRTIAFIIIITFLMSVWSWAVLHVTEGGNKLGTLSKPILYFAKFPRLIKEVKDSWFFKKTRGTYINKDQDFEEINKLDYDLFGLSSFWNDEKNIWQVNLFNFRNDSTIHTWNLLEKHLGSMNYSNYFSLRPFHTLMYDDKSIIVEYHKSPNLIKYDANSNVIWQNNQLIYHHSMNMDFEGNIWVCATDPASNEKGVKFVNTRFENFDRKEILYRDDFITKIDKNTGKILYNKSVSEILIENGYQAMLYSTIESQWDPIHLNDIEPALESSDYWQKGDVFLSLRNLSSILLFRPSTNKIIWFKTGPFISQHDIDIISPDKISVFNNNYVRALNNAEYRNVNRSTQSLTSSEVFVYNFKNQQSRIILKDAFIEEEIGTRSEGLSEILSNGDLFVEEQNEGKVYILSDEGVKLKKVFKTPYDNKIHLTNWIRIFEEID